MVEEETAINQQKDNPRTSIDSRNVEGSARLSAISNRSDKSELTDITIVPKNVKQPRYSAISVPKQEENQIVSKEDDSSLAQKTENRDSFDQENVSNEGKKSEDQTTSKEESHHTITEKTHSELFEQKEKSFTGDTTDKKTSISLQPLDDGIHSLISVERRRSSGGQRKSDEFQKRRLSKGKFALGSVIDIRRSSLAAEYYDKKVARYMNSYKLESDKPFNPEKVENILRSVLTEALENLTYDVELCPKKAKWASMTIRAKIKELEFDRYKLICLVTIGEKTSQDVLATSRFLWDAEKDRYATFSMENTFVFGVAQCFGLYYE